MANRNPRASFWRGGLSFPRGTMDERLILDDAAYRAQERLVAYVILDATLAVQSQIRRLFGLRPAMPSRAPRGASAWSGRLRPDRHQPFGVVGQFGPQRLGGGAIGVGVQGGLGRQTPPGAGRKGLPCRVSSQPTAWPFACLTAATARPRASAAAMAFFSLSPSAQRVAVQGRQGSVRSSCSSAMVLSAVSGLRHMGTAPSPPALLGRSLLGAPAPRLAVSADSDKPAPTRNGSEAGRLSGAAFHAKPRANARRTPCST